MLAANGGTFAIAFDSMQADLHCSREMASLALALYPLGFGIAPLFLASFSEEIGRRWMYIVTTFLFCLCFLPIALCVVFALLLLCHR
jgi:MFS family permease